MVKEKISAAFPEHKSVYCSAAAGAFRPTRSCVPIVPEPCHTLCDFAIGSRVLCNRFIGEESYAGGDRPSLTDDPTWIVDPIDGTVRKALSVTLDVKIVTDRLFHTDELCTWISLRSNLHWLLR